MNDKLLFKIHVYERIGDWSRWLAFIALVFLVSIFLWISFSQFWIVAVHDGSMFSCFLPW